MITSTFIHIHGILTQVILDQGINLNSYNMSTIIITYNVGENITK